MIKTYLIVALVSYLLGSIPFGYILVKLFLKRDIRSTGSGNIGATNVARSGAKGLAIATLFLDALKGFLPVWFLIQHWLRQSDLAPMIGNSLIAVAAISVVLGHLFPIWLRFKGGKGVATALGVFVALSPKSIGIAVVAFVLVLGLTRYVSLASITSAALFPIIAHFVEESALWEDGVLIFAAAVVSAFIILKHHENIRRLLAGTENKFGAKKSIPPPDAMEKQA